MPKYLVEVSYITRHRFEVEADSHLAHQILVGNVPIEKMQETFGGFVEQFQAPSYHFLTPVIGTHPFTASPVENVSDVV